MLANNKKKIKSLEINNLTLKEFILNNHIKTTIEDFKELHYFDDSLNSIKFKLIPKLLKDEIENIIIRKYSGKAEEFFKDNDLYFQTFKITDFANANLDDEKIKIKEGRIQNIANSNKSLKRQLKTKRKNALWHASVLLKLVGKDNKNYCSNTLFNEFKINKVKEQEFIKNNFIVGTDGKAIKLEKATKTKEQNIAEKLNLIKTCEKIADEKGWTWCFITLTLPGEFHPNPTLGKNTYNGISPKDSAKLLNDKIKKTRSLLAYRGIKAGIDYLGCGTAEAHKDGCLHKHLLVYCAKENLEIIRNTFNYHFPNLNDDSFRIEDKSKPKKTDKDKYEEGKYRTTASSYVFKYVMKSINHFDKDLDIMKIKKEDDEALYNAMLNNAFRSYNDIRGFSFFGIENCLTKFRFIARNLNNIDLPVDIFLLVKENNLYELIKNGFFSFIENIYVELNDNKQFIGCKVNLVENKGNTYFKRFFKMVKSAFELNKEEKKIAAESALIRNEKILEKMGLFSRLILNPNYSRKTENQKQKQNNFTYFEILHGIWQMIDYNFELKSN